MIRGFRTGISLYLWPAAALSFIVCSSAAFAQITPVPFAGASGPQMANDQGRTELPMVVRKSVGFREIGPAISGGRVTAVVGVPGKSGIYYVGSADGGIFRTDDGGTTWTALFQYQSVASIGALAVDPVNPQIVWAGTGEANVRNDVSYGDGIYKSTDGGAHWQRMGLEHSFQISAIAIDPHHPSTVLAAVMGNPYADDEDRGVYRTTDGGVTWQKVLYVAPGMGISDLAMNPQDSQILFAAAYRYRRTPWSYSDGGPEDAIYRSLDQGATWQRLSGHGLPEKPVARIGLAIAASSPNVVYAVMGSDEGVVWRSDDSGDHWSVVSKDQEADSRPFYFSHITVDPRNPDHVFAISNLLMESTDGGHSFAPIAKQIHVDHHTVWIDPAGSGSMIDGNDGGIALSRDNGGHWSFVHNVAIGQLYHVSATSGPWPLVCGGLQDNSAWCGAGRTKDPSGILDRAWFTLNGGDGIYAIPAADNPDLVYDSTQNQVLMTFDRAAQQVHDMEPYPRDFTGGGVADLQYRFAWDAGFAVSPQDPKTLYAGGNVVFKSEDRGRTWKAISPDLTRNDKAKQQSSGGPVIKDNSGAEVYDTILIVAPSDKDANVLWVGTDDGEVQLTRDGGGSWTNVTDHIPGLPPWGRIESIDVAPGDPGSALIAVDCHFSGDFKPHLFSTSDYGATWKSISGNLPALYAHVVRRDLRNGHIYYAGLENGLYVSWDEGQHWYLFGLGLPNAAVYDLALDARTSNLIVATHGRSIWILDDLTPFQLFTPETAKESAKLFPPADAVRFFPWSQIEFLGDGAFYGKNPPYGAELSYYLAHQAKDPGQLVITDAAGHVVRTMKGTHSLEAGEAPPEDEDLPSAAGSALQTPAPTQHSEQQEAKPQPPASTQHSEQQEAKPQPPASSQTQQQLAPDKAAEEQSGAEETKEIPWVPAKDGLQRLYWDLRADGPVRWESAKDFNKGPRSGALVPPGDYTATLTIAGHTDSQKLVVVNDPASHGTQAEMEDRYRATEFVLHELSQVDVALNRLDAMHAQLEALRQVAKGSPDEPAVKAEIDAFEKKMKPVEDAITSNAGAGESTLRTPDKTHEKLLGLEGLLEGEDDAPTAAILDQKKLVDAEYQAAIEEFNQFLAADATAFNSSMAGRKLTGVVIGEPVKP
jgi:photosystem II stability/assembly factor-like uncharacterized protein